MNKSSLWDGFVCLIIIPCPPSSNCITAHQFFSFALLEMLLRISAEPPSISCSLYQQRSGCHRLSALLDLGLASPSSWTTEHMYFLGVIWACLLDLHCLPVCSVLLGVGTWPTMSCLYCAVGCGHMTPTVLLPVALCWVWEHYPYRSDQIYWTFSVEMRVIFSSAAWTRGYAHIREM